MKLSIITINLNNAVGLRKTIESVINQTYTDFEYIIIDGASTDESVDIIREYADHINYWVSEPDKGIYNAMNKGILKANGEYLQFLNSGDWLYNNEVIQKVFDLKKDYDILYGCDMLFYNEKHVIYKSYPTNLTFQFMCNGTISHQGTFIKKSLFFEQLYNESFKLVADFEFYIRNIVIRNCSTFYLDFPIVFFDMNGISMSEKNSNQLLEERKKVMDIYIPFLIMKDIERLNEFDRIAGLSLYPYVKIFSNLPKVQRFVMRFMKIILYISGNKNLIIKR